MELRALQPGEDKELITSKETALNYKELYEEAKAKLDEIKKILG